MSEHNQGFAKLLSDFMTHHNIGPSDYAIMAGYGVGQITGRQVTDLDVVLSGLAYNKLKSINDERLKISITDLSRTEKIMMDTPYGEIEFFEREITGFPSNAYSLRNLQAHNRLAYDEFMNPYVDAQTTIEHYAEVRLEGKHIIFGDGYIIQKERLEKNISHLKSIRDTMRYMEHTELTELLNSRIARLEKLLYEIG